MDCGLNWQQTFDIDAFGNQQTTAGNQLFDTGINTSTNRIDGYGYHDPAPTARRYCSACSRFSRRRAPGRGDQREQ